MINQGLQAPAGMAGPEVDTNAGSTGGYGVEEDVSADFSLLPSTSSGVYHTNAGQEHLLPPTDGCTSPLHFAYPYTPRRASVEPDHPVPFVSYSENSDVSQWQEVKYQDITSHARSSNLVPHTDFHETFMPFEQYNTDGPQPTSTYTLSQCEWDFLESSDLTDAGHSDPDDCKHQRAISHITHTFPGAVDTSGPQLTVPDWLRVPLRLPEVMEDEALVPGSRDTCVTPVSPSFY